MIHSVSSRFCDVDSVECLRLSIVYNRYISTLTSVLECALGAHARACPLCARCYNRTPSLGPLDSMRIMLAVVAMCARAGTSGVCMYGSERERGRQQHGKRHISVTSAMLPQPKLPPFPSSSTPDAPATTAKCLGACRTHISPHPPPRPPPPLTRMGALS